jgi:hypothetical protein
MRYGLYKEGRLTAPGRGPWLVVVAKGSGIAAPEEARPMHTSLSHNCGGPIRPVKICRSGRTNPWKVRRPKAYTDYHDIKSGLDLSKVWGTFRRRRWLISSTLVAGGAIALSVGGYPASIYKVRVLLMVYPQQERVVDVEAVLQGLIRDAATVETQGHPHEPECSSQHDCLVEVEFRRAFASQLARALRS